VGQSLRFLSDGNAYSVKSYGADGSEAVKGDMPTSTPTRRSELTGQARDRSSGFTLLELSVVLLILGVAASFVAPRLRDPEGVALAASGAPSRYPDALPLRGGGLRARAMRLNLDLDRQLYFVTALGGDPTPRNRAGPVFAGEAGDPAGCRGLPRRRPAAVGTVTEGTVFAQFSPTAGPIRWSCTFAVAPAPT